MVTMQSDWTETLKALESGTKVQIDGEMFDYFLEVLPPVFMGMKFKFKDGVEVIASFGFAEGYEPVKVFWMEGAEFFCRQSDMMNPRG